MKTSSEMARKRKGRRVVFQTVGPSMARQSAKDECDINLIMKRHEKTGIIEHLNVHGGDYGDFTDVPQDYQSALNQVLLADQMFSSLPARLRSRFQNNPGEFIAFVEDERNRQELVELGLARPVPPEPPADPAPGSPGVAGRGGPSGSTPPASGAGPEAKPQEG